LAVAAPAAGAATAKNAAVRIKIRQIRRNIRKPPLNRSQACPYPERRRSNLVMPWSRADD